MRLSGTFRRPSPSAICLSGVMAFAGLLIFAATLAPRPVAAGDDARVWHHALSLVGEPEYPADFERFRWVNPDAPKGGRLRMHSLGSFDSLNAFSVKGESATGLGLIYDSLMSNSPDEPSAEYGLIAEAVSYPADYSSVTYRIRPEARFHDGKTITSEDVVFSLEKLKEVNTFYAAYYKNVISAEANGPGEVTFKFDVTGNRELPQIMGQLTVLPKHFWTANGADGTPRDLSRSSLEVPLGSGPYRVGEVKNGRSITYERVTDYWAKDLPVSVGQWNFDEISFEFFRDATVAFEAFKAGQFDLYQDSSSKSWATAYDFSAVTEGKIKRKIYDIERVARMQGFVFNLRRPQFTDPRVRQAFNLAFDFEWANKNLFYGLYSRVNSYFDNSELAARGLPEGRELEILETVRDSVPPEVFATPYLNPVNNTPGDVRDHLRAASILLKEAGYESRGGRLVHKDTGAALEAEFLLVSPLFERIVLPYTKTLARLGIKATVRVIDSAQYQRRNDSFDFDVVVGSFAQSESPGNEQRDFWGSEAADKEGSRNIAGIKNPAVDKLIDRVIFAKDRDELVAATRALDRVLLWNHYLVPQWHNPAAWIAQWDMFGVPDPSPSRDVAMTRVWWFDAAKAAAIGRGQP